jgi:predicted Zn-dependent protease
VDKGILEGYFLSTYSARKLGMKTTGNAGGSHHLTLKSKKTPKGGLPALLREMGTGLLVTETVVRRKAWRTIPTCHPLRMAWNQSLE